MDETVANDGFSVPNISIEIILGNMHIFVILERPWYRQFRLEIRATRRNLGKR